MGINSIDAEDDQFAYRMDLKARAKKLKTDIPAIFLALKDKETSLITKIFAGITVAYALSPIDLVPDFIPVLGYLDDVILLPMLVALTIKFIPDEVLNRNRKQAEGMWQYGIIVSLQLQICWKQLPS